MKSVHSLLIAHWRMPLRAVLLLVFAVESGANGLHLQALAAQEVVAPAELPDQPFGLPQLDPSAAPTPAEIEAIKRKVGIDIFQGSAWNEEDATGKAEPNRRKDLRKAQSPATARQKQSLQHAAHELERIAHRLELDALYDAADNLRATAHELRLAARKMMTPPAAKRGP